MWKRQRGHLASLVVVARACNKFALICLSLHLTDKIYLTALLVAPLLAGAGVRAAAAARARPLSPPVAVRPPRHLHPPPSPRPQGPPPERLPRALQPAQARGRHDRARSPHARPPLPPRRAPPPPQSPPRWRTRPAPLPLQLALRRLAGRLAGRGRCLLHLPLCSRLECGSSRSAGCAWAAGQPQAQPPPQAAAPAAAPPRDWAISARLALGGRGCVAARSPSSRSAQLVPLGSEAADLL